MRMMIQLNLTQEDLIILQNHTRSSGSGIEPLVNKLVQEKIAKLKLQQSNQGPLTTET